MPSICKYAIYYVVSISLSDNGFLYLEIYPDCCFGEVWFLTIFMISLISSLDLKYCHHISFTEGKFLSFFLRASEYVQL